MRRTCRDRLSDHNLRRRKRMAEAAPVCAPMVDPAVLWQTTPANAAISRSGRAASRHLVTGEGQELHEHQAAQRWEHTRRYRKLILGIKQEQHFDGGSMAGGELTSQKQHG